MTSFDMVTALLEPTKQILVTSFHPRHWRKYCDQDDTYYDCFFLTYNVTDRYWTKFMNPPVRNLRRRCGDPDYNKVVAVDNTLYLALPFDDYFLKDVLVMHTYDVDKNVWFEGCLNIPNEFFGKHEFLTSRAPRSSAFSLRPSPILIEIGTKIKGAVSILSYLKSSAVIYIVSNLKFLQY